MSDTASKNQLPLSSSRSQGPSRAEGASAVNRLPPGSAPVSDGQPTVITSRTPLPVSSASDAMSPFEKWGLMPGDRLGHFLLIDYVGGGGMGRVFRAQDTRLARTVALKVLSPDQAADPNTVLRFQNEAQSAARLDHQNVARVHYVGEDRGIPFIVFEFIEGVNVREHVMKKGPLPLAEAISYMLQVTDGLAHAASRNVVHRDIKPSNILITAEGEAKLIDLGLARLQRLDPAEADLTASGVTLGTFDYISPEQARDPRSADVRSDIYSLGCTLFFMLAGRPPFPDGTVLQKLLHHQSDQAPEIRDLRPDAPESLGRLLRRMMAKDPRQRHQNPAELAAELSQLATQIGVQVRTTRSSTWPSSQPPKPRRWLRHLPWTAPVLILVAVAVILEWSSSSTESPPGGPASPESQAEPDPAQRSVPTVVSAVPPVASPRPAPTNPTTGTTAVPLGAAAVLTSDRATIPPRASAATNGLAGLTLDAAGGGMTVVEPATWGIAMAGLDRSPPLRVNRNDTTSAAIAPVDARVLAKQAGVLVVGDSASGERGFATLAAACNAAVSGNSIELRYQGRRVQQPMSLGNGKITIRAADKYQPVIVFRPSEAERNAESPRGMIRVAAGNLTLINVALELEIPRDLPAENWSLFELLGAETIRLDRCSLTIRHAVGVSGNDHDTGSAFFRLRAASADAANRDAVTFAGPATIALDDCVARGNAVFVRTETLQPLVLSWDNGWLATSEFLLSATGSAESAKAGDFHQLDLRHLTIVSRSGLCRMTASPSAPHPPRIRVQSSNCIFVGGTGNALIEQLGVENVNDLRQYVEWNGNRDFYQGWGTFWKVTGSDPKTSPVVMPFDAWQKYWRTERETAPTVNMVQWKKLPDAGLATFAQQPSDYALAPAASNPARAAASDGDDVGMKLPSLPALPPNPY